MADEPEGKRTSRLEASSCGGNESAYAEAIDLLATWILEDIRAVANSFGVEMTRIREDALARVKSGIL